MIDYSKIKLVIWDLDDTFWNGTLSEEKITPSSENIELVKRLCERGIVSSICSKNDERMALNEISKLGVAEYFVFNSINWEPKGQRIAQTISDMALRPVNVLFIDDNISNCKEAEFCAPGIMTGVPEECIPELIKLVGTLGKDDVSLSRLKQYKVLEEKHEAAKSAVSNEDFLRSCDIEISINKNCEEQIDRISELVHRSNQLNYTKIRCSTDELKSMICLSEYDCAYIEAKDNFGEYGIIGFYALNIKENKLEHFLFSCRTMGMGIEQFVYAYLGYPMLRVMGDVAVVVSGEATTPDWIHVITKIESTQNDKGLNHRMRILFKGPCDTESSLAFVRGSERFDTEFTFVSDKGFNVSAQNSTYHILQALSASSYQLEKAEKENPFWDAALYKTKMFSGEYDIVFLSVFKDAVSGLYEDIDTGLKFVHGDWYIDITDEKNWNDITENKLFNVSKNDMSIFLSNYRYLGRIDANDIVQNLVKIRSMLQPKCLLVISTPTTYKYIDNNDPMKNDRWEYNLSLNSLLKEKFAESDNVILIDYSDFAKSPDDFLETSNHFSKKVYYEISKEYTRIIHSWGGETIENKSKYAVIFVDIKDRVKKVLRKNKNLVNLVRSIKNRNK